MDVARTRRPAAVQRAVSRHRSVGSATRRVRTVEASPVSAALPNRRGVTEGPARQVPHPVIRVREIPSLRLCPCLRSFALSPPTVPQELPHLDEVRAWPLRPGHPPPAARWGRAGAGPSLLLRGDPGVKKADRRGTFGPRPSHLRLARTERDDRPGRSGRPRSPLPGPRVMARGSFVESRGPSRRRWVRPSCRLRDHRSPERCPRPELPGTKVPPR
jgi:hypothetical protein